MGSRDPVGASAENGGDLPNEPVHSQQLGWIVQLKFERYFLNFYKIPSPNKEFRLISRDTRAGWEYVEN